MNKFNNQSGMTLVEVMIAMVLLTLAIQGAMSLMDFTAKNKITSEHKATMKLASLNFKKVVDKAIEGLDNVNFEKGIFYSFDGATSVITPRESNDVPDINKHTASYLKNSSFSFFQKIKSVTTTEIKREIVSYCVEINSANTELDRSELVDVTHWPFVSFSSTGTPRVRCCPKDNPNCTDTDANIFSHDQAKYIVKTTVYTWKGTKVIKKRNLIKDGEKKHINGIGVYFYTPSGVQNKLRGFIYTYWNSCINMKILNHSTEGCKPRFYKQFSKIQKTFDVSLGGGINELGDLNI